MLIQDAEDDIFKIYQIEGQTVFVHCVLDGRRDLQELLERRLLR